MPLYEFGVGDVFYSQIKTHPSSSFFIYLGSIYYNNKATEAGSFVANVCGVPTGHVSLFELNVDRASSATGRVIGPSQSVDSHENVPDTGLIYPFVHKGSSKLAFKEIKRGNFISDYLPGAVITSSYQMSSSIVRRFYNETPKYFFTTNKTGSAIRNSVDYAARLGQHYSLTGNVDDTGINVIDIPSVFYGSEIKKGTVKLDYYITGTLAGSLRDKYFNGALIQEAGTYSSAKDGEIGGVVLYEEGLILLTGSWQMEALEDGVLGTYEYDGTTAVSTVPSWLNYAFGANEVNYNSAGSPGKANSSASFVLDFAGTQKVPTVTMLAHANRGELNYTNNPTYIDNSVIKAKAATTGSYFYGEKEFTIKNIHSASYSDPTGSLKKTTYITKVGIYDDKKKLIGIASVAKPVKKTEDRDLTFKLKLDI